MDDLLKTKRNGLFVILAMVIAIVLLAGVLRFPVTAQQPVETDEPPRIPEVVYGGGLRSLNSLEGIIAEGFEGGVVPPAGWTLTRTNLLETWEIKTGDPHSGDYYGGVDANVSVQDELLVSPPFTATDGTLTFWSFSSLYWCRDGEVDYCDLEVYFVNGEWDGGSGDDIFLGTADEDWTASWTWSLSSFDISAYTAGTPARIAFRYAGQDGARIGLDDIAITTTGEMSHKVYLPLFQVNHPAIEAVDWTFLVYLAGDSSQETAAVNDFLQLASVGSSNEVHVVAQLDRHPGYDTRFDDWSGTKRYKVLNGMNPTAANAMVDLGEVNMGAEASLVDFVSWGMARFPAERYALVIWDPGKGVRADSAGILDGIVYDETDSGDSLDMAEIRNALNTLTGGGASTLDLLGLDAGLMAMVETDAQWRPYVDLRVGSQDLVPAEGWPYDTILAALVADPTQTAFDLGSDMVDASYAANGNDGTQSAVDAGTDYATLLTEVNDFASALINGVGSYHAEIETARAASQEFANPDHIDLYDFAYQVSLQDTNNTIYFAAQHVMNAVTAARVNEKHGSAWPGAHGIGIYYPENSNSYDPGYTGAAGNLAFTANTQWDEWLLAYYQGGGADLYEPDGSSLLATTLLSGVPQTHNIIPAVDQDWVKFTLQERSGVVLQASGYSGDIRLTLFDSNLNWIEPNPAVPGSYPLIDRICGTDSLEPGTYFVKIEESGNDQEIATYDLGLSVTPCVSPVLNGDFEQGQGVGWAESSTNGWDLVVSDAELPLGVSPHGGDWAAWLGGDEDYLETSIISQSIVIPTVENQLEFWYWIQADIPCGESYAFVKVNGSTVWTTDLCDLTSMVDWELMTVDLSAYAGMTVVLEFRADTIGSLLEDPINQVFIDDVDIGP